MIVTVCTLYREQMCEHFVRVLGKKLNDEQKKKMAKAINLEDVDFLGFSEVEVDGEANYKNASSHGWVTNEGVLN